MLSRVYVKLAGLFVAAVVPFGIELLAHSASAQAPDRLASVVGGAHSPGCVDTAGAIDSCPAEAFFVPGDTAADITGLA
ncbi:hypothetical protein [Actinoallomurus iriomotensis]|uniref:Uncharacterized protein n=1 Tax=Actinoallomurus iriomotensis TaxID=478107 RepID=A0A9W6RXL8_9ACTN|nr:hypothetical protein [Actinoallomurus iriomotensis]GLY83473.1 hypothetical protein Airi02_014030 [Actinoallomurus iriomotensis]